MTVDELKDALLAGGNEAAVFGQIHACGLWVTALRCLVQQVELPEAVRDAFHTCWTEKGHRIRQAVSDDQFLLDALRHILPPYSGGGRRLYRGESWERWEAGALGSAWSDRQEVAEMFGSGLNAVRPDGGVLLMAEVPAQAIIAAPNAHSTWLGESEFVVDRRMLSTIEVVKRFPPC